MNPSLHLGVDCDLVKRLYVIQFMLCRLRVWATCLWNGSKVALVGA